MWDCQMMKPKKTFKGHKKGTFSLAYSMDYHCLLTAGLDQEALVWNPYVERVPIFRLKGHSHALCGVGSGSAGVEPVCGARADLSTQGPLARAMRGWIRKRWCGTRMWSACRSFDSRATRTRYAGLDQEALVWNPYVERVPIFRLKGHSHALSGVAIVPGTAQILTADVAGSFRLWDMRNFRCVQAFGGTEQLQDLNTFCTMPPHKRLAAGSSKIFMYDYQEEWGGENVTDVAGVTD